MKLVDLVPPPGWIVAFAASVTTALWLQTSSVGRIEPEPDGLVQTPEAAQGGAAFSLPPRSDSAHAAELFATRPLLAEGRRPFVPVPVAEPPAPEPPPQAEPPQEAAAIAPEPPKVSMLGIVESAGTRRVLLKDELNGAETWYSVGDMLLGWTIVEILPDKTRLQLQDAEITFNLFGE